MNTLSIDINFMNMYANDRETCIIGMPKPYHIVLSSMCSGKGWLNLLNEKLLISLLGNQKIAQDNSKIGLEIVCTYWRVLTC